MSRLGELIKELCPTGVEYRKLGEIATITRGGSFQKKDFSETGVPCIHYGQIYTRYKLYANSTYSFLSETIAQKQKKAKPNDIIMAVTSENVEDVCKCIAWLGSEEVAVSGHAAIIHHAQNAKYLAYYFSSSLFYAQKKKLAHGIKVIEVTPDRLNDVVVPVPPIAVQNEIVRQLDEYVLALTELGRLLTKEIALRKYQYEHYLDSMLLTLEQEVEEKTLNQIANIYDGTHQTPQYKDQGIPFISVENIDAIYSSRKYISPDAYSKFKIKPRPNDIFMTRIGSIGKCAVVDRSIDLAYYVSLALIRPDNSLINSKYLKYYIESIHGKKELFKRTLHNAVPVKINKDDIGKITIKFPTIAEQNRIVEILDLLHDNCYQISDALEEEIEKQTKRYEFYRDEIMSFKVKKHDN